MVDFREAEDRPEEVAQVEAGRPAVPKDFFSESEQAQITKSVADAELRTAAEIRVRIERRCETDPIAHCRALLEKLGITQTAGRVGLLIYLSIEDHKVAIYGDSAIDAVIGSEGWNAACSHLRDRFAAGDFVSAICDTIQSLSRVLSTSFPATQVNPNELPDEPSLGE